MNVPPLYDESDYEALREEKDVRIAELEAEVAQYRAFEERVGERRGEFFVKDVWGDLAAREAERK
jgi:hypothetical protein